MVARSTVVEPRGERGAGRRLEVGQRPPGIAPGEPDDVLQRVVLERDPTVKAARVGERPLDHAADVVVGERLEGEQQ